MTALGSTPCSEQSDSCHASLYMAGMLLLRSLCLGVRLGSGCRIAHIAQRLHNILDAGVTRGRFCRGAVGGRAPLPLPPCGSSQATSSTLQP